MYPYFYPSYFSPTKTGTAGMNPTSMGNAGMAGTGMGQSGMGNVGAVGAGMGPGGMGNAGMVGTGMGAMQPGMTELPPVLGNTAGLPVESVTPAPATMQGSPVDFAMGQGEETPVTTDIGYTQAYLRTQIGKRVRIEFLIGTNITTDRIGELVGVGISYVLLRPAETDDILMADIYSIKFVTIYQ